ncbi:MAG: hypothetical protein J1G04_02770 [Clostridiales bacterium]|nr:hypothetical protein [Clostridiales bacterium]
MADETEQIANENVEKTIVEDKRDEAKPKRRKSNYERHLVPCPHCGKDILDHFTECPHCGGKVDPLGYHGDEKKIARIKRITSVIGVILSIGMIAAIIAVTYVRNKDNGDAVVPLAAPSYCVTYSD